MRRLLAAGLCAAGLCTGATAAPVAAPSFVGTCAWAKAPLADHTAFAAAYHEDIVDGLKLLTVQAERDRGLVSTCLGRPGAPALWADAAVGAQAIQEASAAELKTLKGLDRAALEQAWLAAPETARACTRANAAKTLGAPSGPCADSRAPLAFLAPLKILVAPEDGDAVRQALYYFTAKAQAEKAEALLARFKIDGVVPQPPAPAATTVKP